MALLNDLKNILKKLTRTQDPVNTRVFNDPLAEQIEWTPAKGGGASFQTHKLKRCSANRVEFRTTIGYVVFCLVFMISGMGMITGFMYFICEAGPGCLVPLIVGLVFTISGAMLYFFGTRPIVFDSRIGYYWKGYRNPRKAERKSEVKNMVRLSDIHALQLISERVQSDKNSYYSYEINLVLQDGKRVNVVDHGKKDKIAEDADALSEFLKVPVWNAL